MITKIKSLFTRREIEEAKPMPMDPPIKVNVDEFNEFYRNNKEQLMKFHYEKTGRRNR